MKWQIQEAKARFSELIERTLKHGPQTVTRHGRAVAVVVPIDEYQRMNPERKDFKQFLASAPLDDVTLKRSRERARRIKF
jgi:prevent-host-death family protein